MGQFADNQTLSITIKSKCNYQLRDCTLGRTYQGRFNLQGSTDLQGLECLKDTVSFRDDVQDVVGLHPSELEGVIINS